MDIGKIDQIIDNYGGEAGSLIQILLDIQSDNNWLPKEALDRVSEKLAVPMSRIQHITTFYKTFSMVPRGLHTIKVCCGTACHLGGADRNLDQIKRSLQIEEGETTADRQFSLETVNCLGTCALAPVVMVEEDYYDEVKPGRVEKILLNYRSEAEG